MDNNNNYARSDEPAPDYGTIPTAELKAETLKHKVKKKM
jgi:hypothetical protein